ncbi:hydroxyacylglutathione hydrolase [Ideonella sp. DXS29W]|uniref:Hydroxyacylglutathione hydrolase n=1 Tax=Ideonella lacteola TaxID=2984193 RepID=A0ABU9BW34_9BURK
MNLVALPAFADNYIWMLHDGREALVVDPGDAAPVLDALSRLGLALTGILVTHHHGDHVGGLAELQAVLRGPVHGPAREAMPVPVVPHQAGEHVRWQGIDFAVLDVPGHTAGHIAYYAEAAPGGPLLFCGDTLFSGGCGRLFEGTPAQMHASLAALAALPSATRVCCAHEYTLSNLRFAHAAEPGNTAVTQHLAHCEALRAQGQATLPSTIGLERLINPFMRCTEPALVETAAAHGANGTGPIEVFAALREWKNNYR